MAGGKETPRQKMIGMMYLVLTALLALNVASTILDAFVAIEENIQVASETEFLRGREKVDELREVTEDESRPDVQRKAVRLMETIRKIDRITADRIKEIDKLKLTILEECGENTTKIGGSESIITGKFPNDPLKPMRMKLQNVEGKDKYDESMYIMIGDDIKNPTGKGMQLWKNYNSYRKELTSLIAESASDGDQRFYFRDPGINTFSNASELHAKIDKAILASKVAPDDREAIKKIYASLSVRAKIQAFT